MPPSAISWVGTVASYLLIVTGVISGPLFDLGYYRAMLFGGAAASTFGTMMLSLSTQYYQIILSQGILMGFGCGVLYIPGLALVSRSFTKRRAMALGIVTCGAPVGGIIYTIIFNSCIDSLGFGWTVRVMGFIMFASYGSAFPLLLWNTGNTGDISTGTARKIFDKKAFTDIGFWLYTWSNFFVSLLQPSARLSALIDHLTVRYFVAILCHSFTCPVSPKPGSACRGLLLCIPSPLLLGCRCSADCWLHFSLRGSEP